MLFNNKTPMKITPNIKFPHFLSVIFVFCVLTSCQSNDEDKDIDTRILKGSWYSAIDGNGDQVIISFSSTTAQKVVVNDGKIIDTEKYGTFHMNKKSIQFQGKSCEYKLLDDILSLKIETSPESSSLEWIDFIKGEDFEK